MNYDNIIYDQNLPESMSEREIQECFERISKGDFDAREIIVEHNIRFVYFIARGIYNSVFFEYSVLDFEDLVSVGKLGLIISVDTYDMNKGVKFSSYSGECIKNAIKTYLKSIKKHNNSNIRSLDEVLSTDPDGEDLKLEDILFDENSDPTLDYETKESYRELKEALDTLPERDRKIIEMRYGLSGYECKRQEDVAVFFGCSRSNIAMIEKKHLRALREKLKKCFYLNPSKSQETKQDGRKHKNKIRNRKTTRELLSKYKDDIIEELLKSMPTEEEKRLIEMHDNNELMTLDDRSRYGSFLSRLKTGLTDKDLKENDSKEKNLNESKTLELRNQKNKKV